MLFFEHKLLYDVEGEVPEDECTIPLGQGEIKRKGKDVTIIATSYMVQKALTASEALAGHGIDAEIVDPRTLVPLDIDSILESVKQTHRLAIVEEGPKRGGVGAEIGSLVSERVLDYLDAPIVRVAALDVPVPFSAVLEDHVLPDANRIVEAVREMVAY